MVQSIIKKLEIENKQISDPNEIKNGINKFLKTYLQKLYKSHYLKFKTSLRIPFFSF